MYSNKGKEVSKVDEWKPKPIEVPEHGKFRPVYFYIIIGSNSNPVPELTQEKYYNTYFVTPIYNQREDEGYVDDILVPYLEDVCKKKNIKWDVVVTKMKGLTGVVVSGRLAAILAQGMESERVPHLINLLFSEE